MDFRDSPEDAAFRKEVKAFLASEFKEGPGTASGPNAERASEEVGRGGVDRFGAYKGWMKKLASKGWIAPAWPKEYGGAGMSIMQQFVFNEEMAKARAPRPGGIGVGWPGRRSSSTATRSRRRTTCRASSPARTSGARASPSPGSGSDLASLQTSAVKDGDDYVINGQKIWTSGAQFAQRMILLARTDPAAPEAQRHLLLPARHEVARRHRAPAGEHGEHAGLQRGVLRQRARPGEGPAGRGEPRLVRRDDDARLRALLDRGVDRAAALGGGPHRSSRKPRATAAGNRATASPQACGRSSRSGRSRRRRRACSRTA